MRRAIWWIKRDIRMLDNEALWRSIDENDVVLPLFVFKDSVIKAPESSVFHLNAQIQALRDLKKRLKDDYQSDILIARGAILSVLSALRKKFGFNRIYSHEGIGSNRTFDRDKKVRIWCENEGVE